MGNSLYDILEVSPDASAEAIRSAYRALSQRCHPDKHAGDPAAVELMAQINRAYAILSDPLQRKNYDASLPTTRPPRTRYHATRPVAREPDSSPSPMQPAIDERTRRNRLAISFLMIVLLIIIAMIIDGSVNSEGDPSIEGMDLTKNKEEIVIRVRPTE